ncbi:MAG: 5'-methylthioadenosine/S-adenosylhomocysteine nucleosidase [Arsenophonus endosymbiont of Ceratovacuna japonica]
MKIAIICAIEQELVLLCKQINAKIILSRGYCNIYCGKIDNFNIIIVKSGIGKVSAAMGTTLLIEYFAPEFIINIGAAGGVISSLKIGDIIISKDVCYHDVNIISFGYQLGQMAQYPMIFHADKKLIKLAKKSIKKLNLYSICGLICSGDKFINNKQDLNYINQYFPNAIAIEMEGAAISQICYQFSIPFIIIRIISDVANQDSHISFKKFLPIVAHKSNIIIQTMLTYISDLY